MLAASPSISAPTCIPVPGAPRRQGGAVRDGPHRLEEVGEFAGRTFDYYAEHPELARLLLREALSGGHIADEAARTAYYRHKAMLYAQAQSEGVLGGDIDPDHLVLLIIGLAAWWFSVPQLARMLTGASDGDPAAHARRRVTVVRAAQRLARSHGADPDGDYGK